MNRASLARATILLLAVALLAGDPPSASTAARAAPNSDGPALIGSGSHVERRWLRVPRGLADPGDMAATSDGSAVYLAGIRESEPGEYDAVVTRYDAEGRREWQRAVPDAGGTASAW